MCVPFLKMSCHLRHNDDDDGDEGIPYSMDKENRLLVVDEPIEFEK